MSSYRTVDGDMVDAICLSELGSETHLAAVYEINPGLADLGPILAAGVVITLPDVSAPVEAGTIRLWGRSP